MKFVRHIIAYFTATSIVYFKDEPANGDTITVGKMIAEFKPFPKYRIDAELLEQRPFMLDVLTEQLASRIARRQCEHLDHQMQQFLAEQGVCDTRHAEEIKKALRLRGLELSVEVVDRDFSDVLYILKLEKKWICATKNVVIKKEISVI